MLSHLIRRVFGNLSSGRRIPSGVLADGWWRRVTRRRRRAGQRFAPSEALESRTLLTAYLVDSLSDYFVAGDNQLTLREALQAANSNMMVGDAVAGSDTDVDTITFADTLSGGTITLGGSQLTITDDVTITGLGADQLGVSGNNTNRVFQINADVTAEITGVTITGGYAPNGGGIFNAGTLTLNSVVVSENESTSSDGGGIYTRGELHLHNSTVKDNLSAFRGGGIFNDGTASTSDSTISGNTSGNFGGGIYSYARHGGSLTVLRSTIHDNFAPDIGGGIRVFDGVATVMQSTISGNSASQGGGIAVAMGSVTVKQSTLANNSAETGGGISVRDSSGSLNASQTIISGNVADSEGDEIYVDNGTVTLDSFNLIGDAEKSTGDALFVNAGTLITGPSDILATSDSANPFPLDKIVGPLADNGGPTLTHTLVAGSPAINAGDKSDGNASSPGDSGSDPVPSDDSGSHDENPGDHTDGELGNDLPQYDQRGVGFARIVAGVIDIGSVELQNLPPVAVNDDFSTDEDTPLTGNVLLDNGNGLDSDPNDDLLTVISVDGPSHGLLTLNDDGSFEYTPDENYHGPDSFTYLVNDGQTQSNVATVSITVNSVNDDPVAEDEAYTTNEDTTLVVTTVDGLLFNDSDIDGDPLTAVVETGPSHGTLSLNDDGSFTYTPDFDFSGMDSFTYRVSDGQGGSAVATVNILIVSAEDQLANLLGEIERLNEESILNNGQANALATKLIGSLSKLKRNQEQVAANKVEAFINQIESLVDEGILTAEEGQYLTDLAEAALISIVN